MRLPFTAEQFLSVFENYNRFMGPVVIVMYVLAAVAVGVLFRPGTKKDARISSILAFYWIWMGIGYHIAYFSAINKAAYVFGGLFVVQGVLFFIAARRRWIQFEPGRNARTVLGLVAVTYALVVYPLIGLLAGHGYPSGPVLGAPCPTTIFTFGLLMIIRRPYPGFLLIVPFLWSIIATNVVRLGIVEDIGLLISGIVAVVVYRQAKREWS